MFKKNNSKESAQGNGKDVVVSFINALNDEDFLTARSFVNANVTCDGADAYFKDIKQMHFKYDIKKVFSEGDDVCLLYDIRLPGKNISCCGWYHLKNHKIDSINVMLNPRLLNKYLRK